MSDNRTALVIDDNFFNRDLCKLALNQIGYQVTEVKNGIEALKLLGNDTYDVMVLDLAMPEMDGITVMRELRDQTQHNMMLKIIVTAHSHMTGIDLEDADFVMYKPIDINAFAQLLRRLTK